MKSLLVIPLIIAAVFGAAIAALVLAKIPFNLQQPIAAGLIACASGVVGLVPILKVRKTDPVVVGQAALAGTILHLLVQMAMAGGLILTHALNGQRAFPLWLLGGYWLSLAVLISQLRRMIVAVSSPSRGLE